jgi:hypothetical protein
MKADHQYLADEEKEPELEQSLEELEAKHAGQADKDVEEEEPLAEARFVELAAVIEQMLEGRRAVDLEAIAGITDDDREALEYLQQVVSGRTPSNTIMYAEERLEGLNQVLAQLQPLLVVGGAHQALHDSLTQLVDSFEELRHRLTGLEDDEEEVFHEPEEKAATGDVDDDDKPKDDDEGAGGDKPRPSKAWDPNDRSAGVVADKPTKSAAWDPNDRGAGVADEKPTKSAAWDPNDRGAGVADEKPTKSAAWDPNDRGAGVADEQPKKSTAWDPDDRGGGRT